jgi:hypothetical protein
MQLFYNSFKKKVKDKLYQKDWPETIGEYIAIAICIDDRLYTYKQ